MGFIKKIWKDRISEFPTRRSLTKTDGTSELVTVARSEGMISEEGDAFSAENMNDFENRVANGFSEINKNLGDLTFAQDADGNWGYKVGGADPVIPFGGNLKPLVLEASQSYTADQSGYVLAFGAAANGNGSNLCSVTIKKNGNAVTPKFATANSLKLGAAWIPVDKGDVISIIPKGVNSNYQASMICFI